MNPSSMGMMGGMGGMNPMMMNPMMGMGDGMNMFGQGMPGMGMGGMGNMGMGGMGGMGGMPGMGTGMGMGPGPMGPGGGPGGPMSGDMGPDTRFYKTKMCHKFETTGECPYGDTCKYAHGPNDQRMPGGGGPSAPRPGAGRIMTPNGPQAGMAAPGMAMGGGGMRPGGMGGGMQPRPPAAAGGGSSGEKMGAYWRTRLCEQFMQTGQCKYGDKCTFAHGHHQLRPSPAGAGNMGGSNRSGGASGSQKRALEQGGGGGGEGNKRQRGAPVQPPPQEVLPDKGGMSLDQIQARFSELQQEANRFAADTGCSVALFTVGGVYTDQPDGQSDTSCVAEVRSKDSAQALDEGLKVAVLKYATGGVANQLISRQEITKFVSQRGVKAMADMYTAAAQEASA